MDIQDGAQTDIWVYEWARDTLSRLTFDRANDMRPVWSPSGRYIAYGSQRNGVPNLYLQRTDGTGETLPLAPGNWEFSVPLASGSATCTRNIQADGDLVISFIDGVEGCGGNGAAMEGEMPADGAMPAEGEMPADGAAPADDAAAAEPAAG